jgi:hypothetical protein
MIRPRNWKGGNLKGDWDFYIKIDGVRMLRDDEGNPVSRAVDKWCEKKSTDLIVYTATEETGGE